MNTKVIMSRYILNRELKENVFAGTNINTGETVCIKRQSKKDSVNLIYNEAMILNHIRGYEGFSKFKYYSSDDDYHFLVTTFLDKTLTQYKKENPIIEIELIINFGKQMINRIEFFHSLKLIHRDIKSDNFMLCKDKIYLIDFGFASKYICNDTYDETEKHIELKTDAKFIGTRNFASSNILSGMTASRRDDIESILYIMIYLFVDVEIWNNINKNLEEKIFQIELLYENILLPKFFIILLEYITNLKFDEVPNYNLIKEILSHK